MRLRPELVPTGTLPFADGTTHLSVLAPGTPRTHRLAPATARTEWGALSRTNAGIRWMRQLPDAPPSPPESHQDTQSISYCLHAFK